MSVVSLEDADAVILKQDWIYRQKTWFRDWTQCWLVVYLDGTVKYFKSNQSRRPEKTFNIRDDCMTIRTGRKCKDLQPPDHLDMEFLIEIILTGERAVQFCAHDADSFRMWLHVLERSQTDRSLPTPRYTRRNLRPEEIADFEEQSWCYSCCRKNKVETL